MFPELRGMLPRQVGILPGQRTNVQMPEEAELLIFQENSKREWVHLGASFAQGIGYHTLSEGRDQGLIQL